MQLNKINLNIKVGKEIAGAGVCRVDFSSLSNPQVCLIIVLPWRAWDDRRRGCVYFEHIVPSDSTVNSAEYATGMRAEQGA